jgi:hypothetical protein
MKYNIDQYYEAVLGLIREAGKVRTSEFYTYSSGQSLRHGSSAELLNCPAHICHIAYCFLFTFASKNIIMDNHSQYV